MLQRIVVTFGWFADAMQLAFADRQGGGKTDDYAVMGGFFWGGGGGWVVARARLVWGRINLEGSDWSMRFTDNYR